MVIEEQLMFISTVRDVLLFVLCF